MIDAELHGATISEVWFTQTCESEEEGEYRHYQWRVEAQKRQAQKEISERYS